MPPAMQMGLLGVYKGTTTSPSGIEWSGRGTLVTTCPSLRLGLLRPKEDWVAARLKFSLPEFFLPWHGDYFPEFYPLLLVKELV